MASSGSLPRSPDGGPSFEDCQRLGALMDVPLVVTDRERRVRVWNTAAEEHLGFTAAEMEGAHCISGIRCPECMGGCPLDRGEREAFVSLHRKDGSVGFFQRVGVVFRGHLDEFLGAVEILRPVARVAQDADEDRFGPLHSMDPAMKRVFIQARRMALGGVPVLLQGETGTGKATLARALHDAGPNASAPFVHVSCGGGRPHRPVELESAAGGSVFIHRVDRLDHTQQLEMVGVWPREPAARLIASAAEPLDRMVDEGRFRADLLYRLRVAVLSLPPLRERPDDVLLLVSRYLRDAAGSGEGGVPRLTPAAEEALRAYRWPGNVRELFNVLEHAITVAPGRKIREDDLPPYVTESAHQASASEAPPQSKVMWALEQSGGHVGRAAELLGMSRSTFWRLRKRLDE